MILCRAHIQKLELTRKNPKTTLYLPITATKMEICDCLPFFEAIDNPHEEIYYNRWMKISGAGVRIATWEASRQASSADLRLTPLGPTATLLSLE